LNCRLLHLWKPEEEEEEETIQVSYSQLTREEEEEELFFQSDLSYSPLQEDTCVTPSEEYA